jgi:oxygen-independent coproporphyrinogen-3 oxidase
MATTHDENTLSKTRELLAHNVARRQSNKVLHGHPSPLLWRERDLPVADVVGAARANGRARRLNLYVGSPYCLPTEPDRCGFCLFPSETYKGRDQLDTYLEHLAMEGEMYRTLLADASVASVYFGGGTANLYAPEQYSRLLEIVRSVLPSVGSQLEITLEGLPQLFTREKLAAIKACGMDRISVGVQQLDPDLIRMSGRKQRPEHTFRTLEWCRELGLRTSLDLIFGWPSQTLDSMLRDLEVVTELGVTHLTHYELNVGGRTDFATNQRHLLPSILDNLELYHASRAFLLSRGYRQVTVYDWEKVDDASSAYQYEANSRTPFAPTSGDEASGYDGGFDVWGWGFAGMSMFAGTPKAPGVAYLNHTRVEDYFARVRRGSFPVERAFRFAPVDLRLSALFFMLQGMSVDLRRYQATFHIDLMEEHGPIWQVLGERGFIEISGDTLSVVGDGTFYLPAIQTVLAHARNAELTTHRSTAQKGTVRLPLIAQSEEA